MVRVSVAWVSKSEYQTLRAVADGQAVRAADLGPWALATDGRLIDHTVNRLRVKALMIVPARGGTPELTADGRAAMEAYETEQAESEVQA